MNLNESWIRYKKNKMALIGLLIIIIYLATATMAPYIMPYNPFEIHLQDKLLPPSEKYIFGTDQLGRDLLSRVIWGTRVSMTVGIFVTFVSTSIGIFFGVIGGYMGGWVDEVIMRITDFIYCLPTFFLVLTIIAIFGPNMLNLILVMGVTMWPVIARLIRAEVLSLKEKDYILASKLCGLNSISILISDILPNALYSVIVASTLRMASAILYEASLSFLGLGNPNMVSWGWIIHESLPFLRVAGWMPIFPGIILSILIIAVNLTGDGLNDMLNPRLKER